MSMTANRHQKKREAALANEKKVEGSNSLRGIALGRKYCDFTPPDEVTDLFRQRNTAMPTTDKGEGEGVLPTAAFLDHLNSTVVERIFGSQMKPEVIKMLMNGIADQILVLVEKGHHVKIPHLMVASPKTLKAIQGRNPRTGETIDLGTRTSIRIQPTYSAKLYFKKGAEE